MVTLRGVLYTLSDARWWLLSVQALDGVGPGLYGALFPLIVADLTRGTRRFNVSQGAISTAQGIGAALSAAVAGAWSRWPGIPLHSCCWPGLPQQASRSSGS